jgi:DNA modification methylase
VILLADARSLPLRDGCVQCVVTSPPYWGLRDYGVPGQLGLEPTPDAYVASLVAVFREVRRVLRDDGVLWLNLGDSYATGAGSGRSMGGACFGKSNPVIDGASYPVCQPNRMPIAGLKPKDLVGIPWRVAFALQADGWYLRSDIIWAKPNPMPESVRDRPTKSHEYLFLLTKRASYYYDADAIAEPASDALLAQIEQGYDGEGRKDYAGAGVQNPSSVKARIIGNARKRADRFGGNKHTGASTQHSDGSVYTGRPTRNRRSVWTVNTQPCPDAHFAVMPEKLVEPCVLAGSRPGDVVLDPFGGSGTVGRVATSLGRQFVLCELNPAYINIARQRTQITRGLPLGGAA